MCAIIDANQAGEFGRLDINMHLAEFIRWVVRGGKVVIGGQLSSELSRNALLTSLLAEWRRAGRIIEVSNAEIFRKKNQLPGVVESNDEHILAICNVRKVDLVLTADQALISDLRNPAICPHRPRIYTRTKSVKSYTPVHSRMLETAHCP